MNDKPRLIDANALDKQIDKIDINDNPDEQLQKIYKLIDNAPSIDAVPVVRCKDCEWWKTSGCAIDVSSLDDVPSADDFCSFGERADEKNGDDE